MNAITLALMTLSAVQADRRPTLTIVAQDSLALEVQAVWTPMETPGGTAFARHEWEARDAADLIANGTATRSQAAFVVRRPPLGDTLSVRVFVRGVSDAGPGPWGWASEPLIVTGLVAAGSIQAEVPEPEVQPTLEIWRDDPFAVYLTATWAPLLDHGQAPFAEFEWEAYGPVDLVTSGRARSPTASVAVVRRNGYAPTPVRIHVRGLRGGTVGPWSGWSPWVNLARTHSARPVERVAPPPAPAPTRPQQTLVEIPTQPLRPVSNPDPVPTIVAEAEVPILPARPGTHEPPGFSPRFQAALVTQETGDRHPDAPLSAPWVMPIVYRAGLPGGEAPLERPLEITGEVTALYVQYGFKLDRRFEGHPGAINRVLAFGYGSVQLVDIISGAGQSPLQYQIGLNGPRPACQLSKPAPRAQRLVPNRATVPLIRGRWYVVELHIQPGTPGMCDGIVRAWFNGQLIMEYDDVGLGHLTTPPFTLQSITIAPQWGTTGSTVQTAFRLWIDEIYVSGR